MKEKFDPKIYQATVDRLDEFAKKADDMRNYILDNYDPNECSSQMKDEVLYLCRDLATIAGLADMSKYRLGRWNNG